MPGTDILHAHVDLGGHPGNFVDGSLLELKVHSLGVEEGCILLDKRIPGVGQDLDEVLLRQIIHLDPDGEMEIDLFRDDGVVHVITTGTSYVEGILWVSSYFGMCRYDGRHWRGYYMHETGLPSDFGNSVAGRSADEAWFATDKGVGVVVDFPTDTWVTYTMDPKTRRGKAVVSRGKRQLIRCLLDGERGFRLALNLSQVVNAILRREGTVRRRVPCVFLEEGGGQ